MGIKDKKLKDFTPEERQEFIDELKARLTDDQYEILSAIVQAITAPETRETANRYADTARAIISSLREFLPALQEELEKDPEIKKQAEAMNADAFFSSDLFDRLADRAVQRLENNNSISFTADEVKAALPQLTSIIPKKHLIPNNKLANHLTKDIIDIGKFELDTGRKKNEIITTNILSYEGDDVKLTSRQPFTEYDRQVADAVTSLYEYGDERHIITAAIVYRAMVNATETETPSPQQIGAVTRSLDKMRFVRVQVDCSQELQKRKLSLNGSQITNGKIDTYLLALKKGEVTAGGQKVTAYKVLETPILYDYSRLTGQVITVPAKLLDIRDESGAKVANTERRIAIKGYLMRRIERMKGKTGNRQSNHIMYDDLYKTVCNDIPTDKEQRLIRDYVGIVLDCWKREKYIAGYEELTQGRKKTGIEIDL